MKCILVAHDGSPAALIALARAWTLARDQKARLHIVRVLGTSAEPTECAEALAQLEEELHQFRAHASDAIATALEVRRGDPPPILAQAGDAADADMIVIGGHDRARWIDVVSGTTAEAVLRCSTRPLLIARTASNRRYHHAVAAVQSEASMRVALDLAQRVGAGALTAVHAYDLPFEAHVIGGDVTATIKAEETSAFRERIEQIIDASPVDLRVDATAVEGDVVCALEEACRAVSADLVILPTHARAGLRWLLRGSVADTVIDHSTRDVLIGRLPHH